MPSGTNRIFALNATVSCALEAEASVKSKAGGKLVSLVVDEVTPVKKGDLIAKIDPSDTEAVYEQAQADLQSANAANRMSRDLNVSSLNNVPRFWQTGSLPHISPRAPSYILCRVMFCSVTPYNSL